MGVSSASKNQEAKEKPPLHGDPAPRMKHFPPLHSMDRAIMKFSSPTHTQNARFPTIFTVLGRYFFHRSTPHNHTVLRRGDLSFTQPPEAPPAWRTPEKPSTPRDAEPDRGAGGRQRGQSKHTRPKPRPIGGRRGACGAWPGFETTRRAKLAARTASGRAGHAAAGDQAGRPRGGRRSGGATSSAITDARHSKRGRHQPTPCASALTHP